MGVTRFPGRQELDFAGHRHPDPTVPSFSPCLPWRFQGRSQGMKALNDCKFEDTAQNHNYDSVDFAIYLYPPLSLGSSVQAPELAAWPVVGVCQRPERDGETWGARSGPSATVGPRMRAC